MRTARTVVLAAVAACGMAVSAQQVKIGNYKFPGFAGG